MRDPLSHGSPPPMPARPARRASPAPRPPRRQAVGRAGSGRHARLGRRPAVWRARHADALLDAAGRACRRRRLVQRPPRRLRAGRAGAQAGRTTRRAPRPALQPEWCGVRPGGPRRRAAGVVSDFAHRDAGRRVRRPRACAALHPEAVAAGLRGGAVVAASAAGDARRSRGHGRRRWPGVCRRPGAVRPPPVDAHVGASAAQPRVRKQPRRTASLRPLTRPGCVARDVGRHTIAAFDAGTLALIGFCGEYGKRGGALAELEWLTRLEGGGFSRDEERHSSGLYLNCPTDIAALDGELFVTDTHNNRLVCLSVDGACLGVIGSRGEGAGQFVYPKGVAVAQGLLYVSEERRVQVLTPLGEPRIIIGVPGAGSLGGVCTDGRLVYVTDADMHCVHVMVLRHESRAKAIAGVRAEREARRAEQDREADVRRQREAEKRSL
eukprot:4837780-Prymnesium_polylepis.1